MFRCRFAPSPTGWLHVGSAQSALFNWLFAHGNGAEFLLRIEDTDTERNQPELTDNILDMLRWLGIDWQGEPVHQSERTALYAEAAERLVAGGVAYWCDCTGDAVQARNKAAGGKPGYDGFCRDRALERGPATALRFRVADDGETVWDDLIRGKVTFENANIEDFVVVRSSGAPLFILANVVDDAAMHITHVIRGEDHVNNTPKYLMLWSALGYGDVPTFAHLPLLVDHQRKKLSKRRGEVDVSVAEYKSHGYLPEAMRNYLALLGWGPPDGVEIRPIDEIAALFRLEDVNPSPAFFDVKKLRHINGEYIRALDVDEFQRRAGEFLPPGDDVRAALRLMAPLVQERVALLEEVAPMIAFLWQETIDVDEQAWAKATKDERAAPMLDAVITRLDAIDWTAGEIEQAVRAAAVEVGWVNAEGEPQLAKAQAPVRVAVTGAGVGPPLWQSIAVLGRERTLARLRGARGRLGR